MRKTVAVFFGGKSCENEISVLTGVFVLHLLDGGKYNVLPVYVHTDGLAYTSPKLKELDFFKNKRFDEAERVFFDGGVAYALRKKRKVKPLGKVDVALNCCHGGLGEGGGMSAMMEWNGIPLASPDLTSSGVFMDKSTTKLFMKALGIPTVDYIRVNEKDYEKRGAFLLKSIESRLKYPVVIKPSHLGSSIGISVARNETEAKEAIEKGFALDDRVIVEKFLEGKRDVNCAAYLREGEICVSEPEEAFGTGIYSFEEKYLKRTRDGGKSGDRVAITGELREKIRSYTRTVYKRMDLKGVVRMDYLVKDKEVYLCEVNTVPGSLAYYLFCERIIDAKRFFTDLVEEGLKEGQKPGKDTITTGILQSVKWNRK